MSNKLNETISNIAIKAYEDHASIREKMCIEEFERIINEQIKSGDFVQHICQANDSFAFTYLPYREKLRLETQLKSLQEQKYLLELTVKRAKYCLDLVNTKNMAGVDAESIEDWLEDYDRVMKKIEALNE